MEALPRVWLFREQENLPFVRAPGDWGGGGRGPLLVSPLALAVPRC